MSLKSRIARLALIPVLTGMLGLSGCSDEYRTDSAEREVAADFVLRLFDGQDFRLSDHKGKPVFINFWASWCIPCIEEAAAIEQVHQEYSKKGVVFVGIAINDTEDKAREFVDEYKLSFATGLDPGEIHKSYPLYGVPTTLFIDKQGKISYLHMGGVTEDLIRHEIDKIMLEI